MQKDYRSMSIAECLGDREARSAFAMATGFSLDTTDDAIEKNARRARWARRKGARA